jgi:hypothetical protein
MVGGNYGVTRPQPHFLRFGFSGLSNEKNISRRYISTLAIQHSKLEDIPIKLNLWFVTDGEGCFTISITKNKKYNTG